MIKFDFTKNLEHTKEQFEELYLLLDEEKNIKRIFGTLNEVEKEQATKRLIYIDMVRKNFLPEIVNVVEEILKAYVDKERLEAGLRKMKNRIKEMNKFYRQINVKMRPEEIKEDFNFWAWLITFMITKKILINNSLEATVIYELLKDFMNDKPEVREYEETVSFRNR